MRLVEMEIIKVEETRVRHKDDVNTYKSGYKTTIWMTGIAGTHPDIKYINVSGLDGRSAIVKNVYMVPEEAVMTVTITISFDGLNEKHGFKVGMKYTWYLRAIDESKTNKHANVTYGDHECDPDYCVEHSA